MDHPRWMAAQNHAFLEGIPEERIRVNQRRFDEL
jgi:hypothetical protein